MEDRKELLKHLRQLVSLLLLLDAEDERLKIVDHSALIDATEQLIIETTDRLFKRGPVFPLPEAI